jgi:hypothetical protein
VGGGGNEIEQSFKVSRFKVSDEKPVVMSMTRSTRSALKATLRGVSWLLLVVAGLTFWVGGRVIAEFAKTDWMFAEMEGISLAVAVGALGFAAKTAADNLDEERDLSGQ